MVMDNTEPCLLHAYGKAVAITVCTALSPVFCMLTWTGSGDYTMHNTEPFSVYAYGKEAKIIIMIITTQPRQVKLRVCENGVMITRECLCLWTALTPNIAVYSVCLWKGSDE